jgi:hypothetical protein
VSNTAQQFMNKIKIEEGMSDINAKQLRQQASSAEYALEYGFGKIKSAWGD